MTVYQPPTMSPVRFLTTYDGVTYNATLPIAISVGGDFDDMVRSIIKLPPEMVQLIKSFLPLFRDRAILAIGMTKYGMVHELQYLFHDFPLLLRNDVFMHQLFKSYKNEPLNPLTLKRVDASGAATKYRDLINEAVANKGYDVVVDLRKEEETAITNYRRACMFQSPARRLSKEWVPIEAKHQVNLYPGRWTTYDQLIAECSQAGNVNAVQVLKLRREQQEIVPAGNKIIDLLDVLLRFVSNERYLYFTCRGCGKAPDGFWSITNGAVICRDCRAR